MFGLSFLSPAFLAAAAAAAIPIALHLFHRRVDPIVRFSALRLLRRAPVEQAHRRRLRELMLLAFRVAACLLLAVVFARPYLAGGAAPSSRVTVVAVDTSFSLTVPGQFDRVRRIAREAIGSAPAGDLVALLSFSDRADVLAPPAINRAVALAAIDRLKPGFGATRYRPALARAAELIGGAEGRVVVVTDLQQAGWDARDEGTVPARVLVEPRDVGGPAGNLAVTAVRREPTGTFVVVQNFGASPRADTVRLRVDGRQFYTAPVGVPADGSAEIRVPMSLPPAGALEVSITDPGGYAADNVRYVALDAAPAVPVMALTSTGQLDPDAFYLTRALQAGDAASIRLVPLTGERFSSLQPSALSAYGAVLVLGTRGVDRRGRTLLARFVERGGGVLIAAGPEVDPDVIREALGDAVPLRVWAAGRGTALAIAPADARHPILLPFAAVPGSLARVRFDEVARVDSRGGHVIARYDDGTPALVEWRTGGGRLLLFASDLNNRGNDFPLHAAFVPFVHELIRYLVARRAAASDVLVADAPPGVAPQPGVVTLPKVPGVARAGQPLRMAINVDLRESNPARTGVDGFLGAITRPTAGAAERRAADEGTREKRRPLWPFAAALALVVMVGEAALGRRMA